MIVFKKIKVNGYKTKLIMFDSPLKDIKIYLFAQTFYEHIRNKHKFISLEIIDLVCKKPDRIYQELYTRDIIFEKRIFYATYRVFMTRTYIFPGVKAMLIKTSFCLDRLNVTKPIYWNLIYKAKSEQKI